MAQIGLKEYAGCQITRDGEPLKGFWHFCCIHRSTGGDQIVYPVGRCRENNQKDKESCKHKTEQEAVDCYRTWELEGIQAGRIFKEEDILFEDNKIQLKLLTQ